MRCLGRRRTLRNQIPFGKSTIESYKPPRNSFSVKEICLIIEKGNSHGTFDNCNKEGLLNFIDCYVRDNMDHKALALVHPSLVDFVCLLTRDTYDTEIIMLKAEKAGDKYTLIALPDIPSP